MRYKFEFIDLWPYLIILLVFLYCLPYMRRNRVNSALIFGVLLLFTILRYDVGWDYFMYRYQIQTGEVSRFEFLSRQIFGFAHWVGFFPLAFFFFGFFILWFTKVIIDRFSVNTILSWAVFCCYPQFFLASLSTIRQSLAAAIIFYSFRFCYDRKPLYFLLCIGIASLFHTSALAGIILYPLVRMEFGRKFNVILFSISFFISEMIKNVIFPLIASQNLNSQIKFYLDTNFKPPTLIPYLIALITAINLLFYKRLVELDPDNKKFITITTVGAALYNILVFEPNTALRISSFFLIFWAFLFPWYGSLLKEKNYNLNSVVLVLVWFFVFFAFMSIYITAYQSGITEKISFLPYKFWFDNL